jgi:hypothetical protein
MLPLITQLSTALRELGATTEKVVTEDLDS